MVSSQPLNVGKWLVIGDKNQHEPTIVDIGNFLWLCGYASKLTIQKQWVGEHFHNSTAVPGRLRNVNSWGTGALDPQPNHHKRATSPSD